jgi:hypothetical protein
MSLRCKNLSRKTRKRFLKIGNRGAKRKKIMNRRQIIALEGANPSLFNKNMEQAREYVNLKGLKLSTVLTVDYIGGSYAWHASVAAVDPFSLMPIAPNKVSKANKIRIRNYLEKMLEGVGGENFHESEAYCAFNLFRYLTANELHSIKGMAA